MCTARYTRAGQGAHRQSPATGRPMDPDCRRGYAQIAEDRARQGYQEGEERRTGRKTEIRRGSEGSRRERWMDLISEGMARAHARVVLRVVSAGVRFRF